MFRVRLDNENRILGFASGRVQRNFIRILPVNRIKIVVSSYDSTIKTYNLYTLLYTLK
uniref:Translational initiation factor 1 n=1 Tax=Rubus eucalyptus TaxID=1813488 RepID=A0A896SR82_9ROSA|nr:translational initiation factor 1 [Rubus eucalyptus]QSD57346.1 translational initiation factor 1 [Rubus eucalyptus]